MDNSISLFHTLFYVSAAVAAMGLALAVFFFFYFDIPTVRAMMTGRARQETVRRMAEQNAHTGRLRFHNGNSGDIGKSGKPARSGKLGKSGKPGKSGKLGHTGEMTEEAVHINPDVYQRQQRLDTSVLTAEAPDTTTLDSSQVETAVLNRPQKDLEGNSAPVENVVVNTIGFCVTETTLVIHTDELL